MILERVFFRLRKWRINDSLSKNEKICSFAGLYEGREGTNR